MSKNISELSGRKGVEQNLFVQYAKTSEDNNGTPSKEDLKKLAELYMIGEADIWYAMKEGINDGDLVCVESPRGKVDIKAQYSDAMKPGVLSSTFHFPEIMLNVITSDEHCSESLCPEYKVVSCRIRKSKGKYAKKNKQLEKML